jgi:hypothetical protein
MKAKPYVYLATSLTHVPVEERPQICELVRYLKEHTKFLQWAFDPETWTPKPVRNICGFHLALVTKLADYVAGVFWSSAGSDGRGAELLERAKNVGVHGMGIYVLDGVKITPFITEMIKMYTLREIRTFKNINELGGMILRDSLDNPATLHFTNQRDFEVEKWERWFREGSQVAYYPHADDAYKQFVSLRG